MNTFKNLVLRIVGWLFVVLGILGLFLPVLQGILFIMIGLAILSSRSDLIRRFLRRLEERHPHYHQKLERFREKAKNWFKKD